MKAFKTQVDGNHYKNYSYQPAEFFMDIHLNFSLAAAIKYIARIGAEKDVGNKGIDKAIHFIELYRDYFTHIIVVDNTDAVFLNTLTYGNRIRKFTSQFNEQRKAAIEAILYLATGGGWTHIHQYEGSNISSSKVEPDNLADKCKNVIQSLNKLKEQ